MILRHDLPVGTALAMAVHAAGESGHADPGTVAVVLAVADELALRALFAALDAGHEHCPVLITEPDSPWHGQAMAIGFLTPHGKSKAVKHLRLWRPK